MPRNIKKTYIYHWKYRKQGQSLMLSHQDWYFMYQYMLFKIAGMRML
jgi:hypothetical protein